MAGTISDTFNIELRYQQYLKLGGISEQMMHETQRVEMKRVFYAGMGMMHTMMIEEAGKLNEAEAIEAINSLEGQVIAFYQKENGQEPS